MPYMRREGDVFVVHLGERGQRDTENRFHPDWLFEMNALLDEALASEGPAALVTTGDGKHYSTGADLAWCAGQPDRADWYLTEVQLLMRRILTLSMPVVAALNGHTFGAGAFLAVAHDHRVMRADRGFFCFPGVTLGANYAYPAVAMLRSRLPAGVAHEALVTGRRYGAADALAAGLVDATAETDRVLPLAVEYAQSLAHTRGPVLAEIKTALHRHAVDALQEPVVGYTDHALIRHS
ncbi:enoyl-CoA hydratase/isomerase family protein [Nocardia sp. NPDC050435]|uniref:enoyl-CoA hydratase/isomerase family protein n=1 Tax=Nocardia sp. NPDC050435 TaxID=3155040 RepID=UPI0033FB17C9